MASAAVQPQGQLAPSEEQSRIVAAVRAQSGNVVVNSVAGSGERPLEAVS